MDKHYGKMDGWIVNKLITTGIKVTDILQQLTNVEPGLVSPARS